MRKTAVDGKCQTSHINVNLARHTLECGVSAPLWIVSRYHLHPESGSTGASALRFIELAQTSISVPITIRQRHIESAMFEKKHEPLLPRAAFLSRLGRSFGATLMIVAVSLLIGSAGYHHFGEMSWIDALLNAAMILTGDRKSVV